MILEILLPVATDKTFYYKIKTSGNHSPKIGNLVEVDFRGKNYIGMICRIEKSVEFKNSIKEIKKVFREVTFNKELVESLFFLANYSCNKLSLIFKLFLSAFPKKIEQYEILNKKKKNPSLNIKKLELTSDQISAINFLKLFNCKDFNVVVLDGVTGSGKTRVYMHKAAEIINMGYQCLILVPEIILTQQWVKEIIKDFNLSPEVYHSSITKKKKELIWLGAATGKIDLILGTRSALFLPFKNLGLIVVDEEHDISYKQQEQIIFNVRDFAVVRAKKSNCLSILCSATPSVETISNFLLGKYKRVVMQKRINKSPLPTISSVDMKMEKKNTMISKKLENTINYNLKKNLQTLIFINKRGYAPFVICQKCGSSKACINCNTFLVLHSKINSKNSYLLCHQCNYKENFVNKCSNCAGELKFPGTGIEKISERITNLFPKAKICMLSSDYTKNKKKFEKIIENIVSNKVDIIIGTQLVSKGHNFPNIKTVGILNIDNLLNDFDFRSNEKAFQQIVQVSGRAGRINLIGEVFIQSFQPEHPVIKFVKSNDKEKFYKWEIKLRKQSLQPPFSNLISLTIESLKENLAKSYSKKISNNLKTIFKNLLVYGPAPAIIFKRNQRYRYKILLKMGKKNSGQREIKNYLLKIIPPYNVRIYTDVDPTVFL